MIIGWDTTITLSGGAGEAVIYDTYNSLELRQIIAVPSDANMQYDLSIFNTNFNLTVFGRTWTGTSNELLDLPLHGSNLVRISNATPTTGTVVVAMRFRWP